MAEFSKRIGWGEPVALDAMTADTARDLITEYHPKPGTNDYTRWNILRSVLIPPVEACAQNREAINMAADWISGLVDFPGTEDPDYEDFEHQASSVLVQAIEAYITRPGGCEMVMTEDQDCFDCERCNFSRSTDISS